MMQGSCHCGKVRLTITRITDTATECNCSLCRRYAPLWGYLTESEVGIESERLEEYAHGDRMIRFQRCPGCGCITHYRSVSPGAENRLAVNYRMFAPEILQQVRIRHFDGADSWQYLE